MSSKECRKCRLVHLLRFCTKKTIFNIADCPEVGTVSQGKRVEEAVANLKEAAELYLEEFPPDAPNRPLVTPRLPHVSGPATIRGILKQAGVTLEEFVRKL